MALPLPLDAGNIAIYRQSGPAKRLCPLKFGAALATLGVSDAFIVPVEGEWQPFIELTEGRQRWALAKRPSLEVAQTATRHFLQTLADGVCHTSQVRGVPGDKDADPIPLRVPRAAGTAGGGLHCRGGPFARALSTRESSGWELIYSRQRL